MPNNDGLYIGIMSGTSLDGIDVALVDIVQQKIRLVSTHAHPLASNLREQILELCRTGNNEIERMGALHLQLGSTFAKAVNALLQKNNLKPENIVAIGSHGQTIRHLPQLGFTLQIGSADVITAHTGIPVVTDFRNHDMVLGGQGAPLVPTFHQHIFAKEEERRAIVNIGGMANISLLNGTSLLGGFDTGPGNVLMNYWAHAKYDMDFDIDGRLAASGRLSSNLLERMLADEFFHLSGPKSTGREKFNPTWLTHHLNGDEPPADVMATLLELTALSIASACSSFNPTTVLLCGGGAHNKTLLKRLRFHLPLVQVDTTATMGWHPDWIEAACFGWMAWARMSQVPITAPCVTGASRAAISGAIYLP